MRFPGTLVVGGAVVLAFAGARAQISTEDEGLRGYVLAPDGAPVSGGRVVARFGMGALTASIEPTGRFRLTPRQSGGHQVLVSVPGFAPFRFTVAVPPSRSLRLPIIRLSAGAHVRVRLIASTGEPILAPQLHRRLFAANGESIDEALADPLSNPLDADGAVTIGPLPRGVLTLAVDMPFFAQTRLPDVNITDPTRDIDAGTVVVQQPGAVLHVDVVDGNGAAVPDHPVAIEDPRPRSPLALRPERTTATGRATFERLAAGQYRVSTLAVERCAGVWLTASRTVRVSANGTVETPLVIGGPATFHVTSPLGPASGVRIAVAPNVPAPPAPSPFRRNAPGCEGVTDGNGRVTLANFPPGPGHIAVRLPNSTFTRQVDVPLDGRELPIVIPDGFLPVHVVNEKNEPVRGATIAWAGSGGRVEATAMVTGDALLEGVGTSKGTLTVSAPGYQQTEEALAEPPGVLHSVVLSPLPTRTRLRAAVTTVAGEPLSNAVVEFVSSDLAALPRVAVTDRRGLVSFGDLASTSGELIASADGFVASTRRVAKDTIGDVMIALSRGYRAIADVALPLAAGPQLVRVTNDSNRSMDDLLDGESDRRVEPVGRLSLGPLPPGTYVIELQGAAERRQARVRIVDRDVYATVR